MSVLDLPSRAVASLPGTTHTAPKAASRRPQPARSVIATIAIRDLRDAVRNRWLISFAIVFALLSGALMLLTRSAAGDAGAAGFGRTAAGLVNLVMVLVPLMSMTATVSSIAGDRERGLMALLLAQPVSLTQVVLGKFLGLSMAVVAAVLAGFGVGALVIAGAGGGDASAFLLLSLLTAMLAVAMVSTGLLVCAFCSRTATATTAVLLSWLGLVFACDLVLMGSHIAVRFGAPTLFHLALANPLQAYKFAALKPLGGSLDILGPSAAWANYFYGAALGWLLVGALAAWVILPLAGALFVMRRRGAA